MSTLYPTKTRLALLQAVADGDVYKEIAFLPYDSYHRAKAGISVRRRVSARCEELHRAGWIELNSENTQRWSRPWRLTDAGRAVLDSAS